MRISEKHPLGSQSVHVRRQGLRITLEHACPVIEIINRDEQYVRLRVGLARVLGFACPANEAE